MQAEKEIRGGLATPNLHQRASVLANDDAISSVRANHLPLARFSGLLIVQPNHTHMYYDAASGPNCLSGRTSIHPKRAGGIIDANRMASFKSRASIR
jgi:hypothetical protein